MSIFTFNQSRWRATAIAITSIAGIASLTGIGLTHSEVPAGLMDPLRLLSMRSPGDRIGAALSQTKKLLTPNRPSPAPPGPTEVGSHHPNRPVEQTPQLPPEYYGEEPFEPVSEEPVYGEFPFAGESNTAHPVGFSGIPVGGFGFLPGSGVASPGSAADEILANGALPSSNSDVPTQSVSAVPEPETWLTLVLGFFLIGWMARRRLDRSVPRNRPAERF